LIPTTSAILDPDRPKAAPDDALWLWGRALQLEREGYLEKDINEIISRMSAAMKRDMATLMPKIKQWIKNCDG